MISLNSNLLLMLILLLSLAGLIWLAYCIFKMREHLQNSQAQFNLQSADLQHMQADLLSTKQEYVSLQTQFNALQNTKLDLQQNYTALKTSFDLQAQHYQQAQTKLLSTEQNLQTSLQNEHAHLASMTLYKQQLEDAKLALQAGQTQFNQLSEQAKQLWSEHFYDLSKRLLNDQTKQYYEQQTLNQNQFQQLQSLELQKNITPLLTHMQQLQEKLAQDTKDTMSLKGELYQLVQLNKQLDADAKALTQALKGQNKQLGNWGELILERLFECAGLQKGIHYSTQASFKNEDEQLLRPDMIVHLDEQRTVVVDSKMSATILQQDDAQNQQKTLESIKKHVQDLAGKHYQNYKDKDKRSIDLVLMFVPAESIFQLVMQQTNLFDLALSKQVLIVGPSNLIAVLKSIHYTWQKLEQQKNLEQVLEDVQRLYDKIHNALKHFEGSHKALNKAKDELDNFHKIIAHGKGNVMVSLEKLKRKAQLKPAKYDANIPYWQDVAESYDGLNLEIADSTIETKLD